MPSPTFSRIPERSTTTGIVAVTLAVAATLWWGATDSDSPHAPVEPRADTVLVQLDNGDEPMLRLAKMWQALRLKPGDADTAGRYARLALKHYAARGDARFLGYAEGALTHWREAENPPLPIWLLRGRILQTQHRFADAGDDLDRLLAIHTDSAEGMLLAADAWRRAGNIDRARSRCAGLALIGRSDLARYCAADVLLSLGKALQAHELLSSGETLSGRLPAEIVQWRFAVAADAAVAAGRVREARSLFERALDVPGAGIALYTSYADLLLGEGRPREAIEALSDLPDADAVLLRRAVAAKQLGHANFDQLRMRLRARFADARAFDAGALHLREQALHELLIEEDADTALALAGENWTWQKGPEDAALLVQAARAAGRPDAARAVEDWRKQFGGSAI